MSVSRALNAPQQVSPQILAKVQAAVERMGYVANRAAGSLASSRSRLIGAVLPSLAGSVFQDLVQSLVATLADADYQLLLGQSGYGVPKDDRFLDALISRRPDGIVLCGVTPSADGVRRLSAAGIPVVETWDMVAQPIDMVVGFSHERIAAAVAAHLQAQGRKAFAFAGGDHARGRRRGEAFRAALQATGRRRSPPVLLEAVPAPGTVLAGRLALRRILQQQPATDAVFCGSDLVALGMVTEAKELGLDIPKQLAVIGFGDTSLAPNVSPALSTVRIDAHAIGIAAAQNLIRRSQGLAVDKPVVDVGFELVVRETG